MRGGSVASQGLPLPLDTGESLLLIDRVGPPLRGWMISKGLGSYNLYVFISGFQVLSLGITDLPCWLLIVSKVQPSLSLGLVLAVQGTASLCASSSLSGFQLPFLPLSCYISVEQWFSSYQLHLGTP